MLEMRSIKHYVTKWIKLVLIGCGGGVLVVAVVMMITLFYDPSSENQASKIDTLASAPRVIIDSDSTASVMMASDMEAVSVELVTSLMPQSDVKAKFDAMMLDGRLFEVPNGTRAIMEDIKQLHGGSASLVKVLLLNGPRAGSEALCFSRFIHNDSPPPARR